MEIILIAIGIAFVGYFTYKFIKKFHDKEGSFWKNLWQWIKNVFDSITGIG